MISIRNAAAAAALAVAVTASATAGNSAASAGATDLQVQLAGLRSAKGMVLLCLSANPSKFLKCKEDPSAVSRSIPAGSAGRLDLGAVRPGTYALLVVHDENRNGKFDMMMGIPREGFGFSNNPAIRPRAPRWEEIKFTVPPGQSVQQVRVRYIL